MNHTASNSQVISVLIHAPRARVYHAFLDPEALTAWMAPGDMRLRVHTFEARVGGQFRISLKYPEADSAPRGKTDADTDSYHGHFAELVPDEKIVEVIEFESADPGLAGAMTMTVTLAEAAGGTQVTLRYDNLPLAILPADNDAGTRESLKKLAALLE